MTAFELLDYSGTAVFAISGALAAINRKFDPFGVTILAAVTAIGGGTLRDMLIGRTPVGWMQNIDYLYIVLAATVFTVIFKKHLSHIRKTLFLFDSIGLALFTIIGVELGLQYQLDPIVCILLGTMTAAFGGVLRDVLSSEVPLIFQQEIYASASIIGGLLFWLLLQTNLPINWNYVIVSFVVIAIRICAVKYHWELPKIYKFHQ